MADFKKSPLAQFVTEPTTPADPRKTNRRKRTEQDRARIAAENAQYKAVASWNARAAIDNTEPRTRRVQLMMKPSIHERARNAATAQGQSLNNLIEELLVKFLEDSAE